MRMTIQTLPLSHKHRHSNRLARSRYMAQIVGLAEIVGAEADVPDAADLVCPRPCSYL